MSGGRRVLGRDAVAGAVALALAVAYGVAAQRLPESLLADPVGAAGLPRWYAIALALLAIVLIVRSPRTAPNDDDAAPDDAKGRAHLRAFGLLVPGIAYLLLVGVLGYFATVLMLIVAVALYLDARPGLALAAIGVGGAVVMWAAFVLLLGIPLPTGSLWALGR